MLSILRGDYELHTQKELHDVPLPPQGDRSHRWKGIVHGDLVTSLKTILTREFSLYSIPKTEIFAISPNGAAMIGGFSLGVKNERKISPKIIPGIPQETVQAIGFTHSNDSRKALRIYAGGRVGICHNGLVSASYAFKRKHTIHLDLDEWIAGELSNVLPMLNETGSRISSLFEHKVSPRQHDNMMLRLARENIIPWRLLGDLDTAWSEAIDGNVVWVGEGSNSEEWGFEQNAWDWYNAVTHIGKRIPPAVQLHSLEDAFNVALEMLPKKTRPDLSVAV